MQKINEDEKKLNLIKCPLPKIIYSAMSGFGSIPKKSETSSTITTYYSKKNNKQRYGLPSLKKNIKFSSSPNKTNYINIKISNNLANNSSKNNNTHDTDNNKTKINKQNDNDNIEIKKPNLKELLNSYGLIKYYDKIVELGINDQNMNNLALMNKKEFNEFISNLRMFPGHLIKMEQLYQNLKQINYANNKKLHNNSNPKINEKSNNDSKNNSVNYVTLTFNRKSNNSTNKIIHSQSHNKYRFINTTIKPKSSNIYSNIEITKTKSNQQITDYTNNKNIKYKSRSKGKVNTYKKSDFEFPKPINPGRNVLIKYFFKDLANFTSNISGIVNNLKNSPKMNLYTNYNKTNSSVTSSTKDLNLDKQANNFTNTYNENQLSRNNIPENYQNDLPSINNYANNTNKTLTNSIYTYNNSNQSSNLDTKYENPKTNRAKLEIKINNNSNDQIKIDKSKTIDNYKRPYTLNTYTNIEHNKRFNFKKNLEIQTQIKYNTKKEKFKNNNNTIQKTQYETTKKNKIINNILKLPNVIMNKTEINTLSKQKGKNEKPEQKKIIIENQNNKEQEKNNKENKNIYINTNSNIVLKSERTILKKNNKNIKSVKKESEINKNSPNVDKQKEKESNTIVIQSWDDNNIIEEKKPIKLREKSKDINNKDNKIIIDNKIEDINNIKEKTKNKKEDTLNIKITKNNEITKKKDNINEEINNNINNNNNTNLNQKKEISESENPKKENDNKNDISYTLEDIIYENLRLNHSFSEDKNNQSIYSFDLEFVCRCVSFSLLILIETSKESPHITEINLEALSSSSIKYFFFNDIFNENINLLFDLFDKEVNKNINIAQISPLDKLDLLLSKEDDDINYNINFLKHIRKENDEVLLKKEEEKNKNGEKNGKENFKIRTGLGDIEKDIKFIDEFFSMNSKLKKKVINYQYVSDISKNVLCKELSYINEIDSELNGTNSNINNTNFCNNSNSNNNINDNSIRAKKMNISNSIDNEELKEIKEIKESNNEDNNNTFNNEMNELGIIADANEDNTNKNDLKKNLSNNSINLGEEDMNNNTNNKKEELKQFELGLNEDNKIINSPINNREKHNISNSDENKNNDNDNNQKGNSENKNIIKKNEDLKHIKISIDHEINNEIVPKKEEKETEIQTQKDSKEQQIKEDSKKNTENTTNKEIQKDEDEEEKFEYDYIIDISSLEELTYYLIKRAEIFDEDFNYLIMKMAERRFIPPPDPQTIFDFIADIFIVTKMEREVIILALIYIERLIFNTGLLLTSRNWRRILLTAMIIASKVWDDNSFENNHFAQVFSNLGVSEINTLERIFLELINYKIFVKQSEYFKYLLMIKTISLKYNYDGKQIIPVSIIKNMKYQEFTETMQNRMRKKVTLNNSAQF